MYFYEKNKSKLFTICLVTLLLVNSVFAAEFNPDTTYSRWIINSRMSDFRNKSETIHFKTETTERNIQWDYVPGLVAKAILMTWEHYQNESWSIPLYNAVEDYADHIQMRFEESNIDDLNAGKIFFELYRGAKAKGQDAKAENYKKNATICRNKLINDQIRIAAPLPGTGGFWHKKKYVNQMWLDGLYMGPALYAEWQGNFGMEECKEDNYKAWDDIALQFDTVFAYTWDYKKKLNYHAWSAEPQNDASSYWANPTTGQSEEFWARGMGWFFAALVDVLENMPDDHSSRTRFVKYVNMVADGLKARQDAKTGCWYQLLQYDSSKTSSCGINNYLESSASAMYTYAYLKGIRLGVLDNDTFMPIAQKAYKGLINNFIVEEPDGKIKIIQSCESAGLSNTRKGDADYYLCGQDVRINNDTEGKVLGPFIMASLEFEKLKKNKK
jgi:unsaturated rhamnogalacturonyl hydrolase